ncbi:hypothetical protein MMC28_005979 [Mycoblastus sanguinarius]|nr:hypothetical protein [Mycoblastus sanguinarius]
MGFASFGANKPNPPKKKRKLGDASGGGGASGSNNTPLGVRGRKAKSQGNASCLEGNGELRVQNGLSLLLPRDDGVLDVDAREEEEEETARMAGQDSTSPKSEYGTGNDGGEVGGGISGSGPKPMSLWADIHHAERQQRGALGQAGRREDGEWDWQALRRGVRDERGDMAIYDARFVEDPWRGLLQGKGVGRLG